MRALKVRPFRKGEAKKLRHMVAKGRKAEHVRWAQIILGRAERGVSATDCAWLFGCCLNTVRCVVQRWNEKGMKMFSPRVGVGHPVVFSEQQRRGVVQLAQAPPQAAGKPWTQWSLYKLVDAATGAGIVARVSHETIRQWLRAAGITPQRTKTWKRSNDPEYDAKKNESSGSTGDALQAAE